MPSFATSASATYSSSVFDPEYTITFAAALALTPACSDYDIVYTEIVRMNGISENAIPSPFSLSAINEKALVVSTGTEA